jgi:hypothetical protein
MVLQQSAESGFSRSRFGYFSWSPAILGNLLSRFNNLKGNSNREANSPSRDRLNSVPATLGGEWPAAIMDSLSQGLASPSCCFRRLTLRQYSL